MTTPIVKDGKVIQPKRGLMRPMSEKEAFGSSLSKRHFREIHPGTGTDQSVHAGGAGGTQGLKSAAGVDLSTWRVEDDNAIIGGDEADAEWLTEQARRFAERTGVVPTGITFVINDPEAYVDVIYGGQAGIDKKMDALEVLAKARGAHISAKEGAATDAIFYNTDAMNESGFMKPDAPIFGPHEGDPLYGGAAKMTAVHEISHWLDDQTGGSKGEEHYKQFAGEIPEAESINLHESGAGGSVISTEYRADILAAYIMAPDPTQPVFGRRHFFTNLSPESIEHVDILLERMRTGLKERSFVMRSLANSVFVLIDIDEAGYGEAVLVDAGDIQERHFAEIHPGTGTDQSVHAGGGGVKPPPKGKKKLTAQERKRGYDIYGRAIEEGQEFRDKVPPKTGPRSKEGGGQNRFIVAEDDRRKAVIRVHRRDFEMMDPVLRQRLADEGVTWVVTAKPMSEMVPRLKGVTPRGWEEDDTWDRVAGGYEGLTNTVYAGTGDDASSSIILHETGHALDDVIGISENNNEFHDIHVNLSTNSRLGHYFNQDGPGGIIGKEELFAEAFSMFHKRRDSIIMSWGPDLDAFIEKTIEEYIDG